MKNLLIISLLLGSMFSCTKNQKFDSKQYPQKWQLIKMTGQLPNSETTGTNMEWQEYYLLNSNGTFTKSREQQGILTKASGTYTFKNLSDGTYLELTYESDNALIGSCISGLKESLWLKSGNRMMDTWSSCDGPGLEYERVR